MSVGTGAKITKPQRTAQRPYHSSLWSRYRRLLRFGLAPTFGARFGPFHVKDVSTVRTGYGVIAATALKIGVAM